MKGGVTHSQRRLRSPRGRPPAVGGTSHQGLQPPAASFADCGLSTSTRPPSPTEAATSVASLSQTLRDDFCNQHGIRAHRTRSVTSHAPRCLAARRNSGREDRSTVSRSSPSRNQGRRRHGTARTGREDREPACCLAAERPTLGHPSTPLVTPRSFAELVSQRRSRRAKAPDEESNHANGPDPAGCRGAFHSPRTSEANRPTRPFASRRHERRIFSPGTRSTFDETITQRAARANDAWTATRRHSPCCAPRNFCVLDARR